MIRVQTPDMNDAKYSFKRSSVNDKYITNTTQVWDGYSSLGAWFSRIWARGCRRHPSAHIRLNRAPKREYPSHTCVVFVVFNTFWGSKVDIRSGQWTIFSALWWKICCAASFIDNHGLLTGQVTRKIQVEMLYFLYFILSSQLLRHK